MNTPTILYFGMLGELSRRPLAALIESGAHLGGVVIPGTDDQTEPMPLDPPDLNADGLDLDLDLDFVPMVSQYMQPSAITLAWENHIPLLCINDLNQPQAYQALAAFRPDLIFVSCFSKIIPPALLALPPLGALNFHPALLPRYRGPAPLFWQFRNGEPQLGATIHYMTERLDAGDIVLQRPVDYPDGVSGSEAEALCAEAGAELLIQALDLIRQGQAPRRPQIEAEASYFPLPSQADLTITTAQPARRAFNFIRSVESPSGPLPFDIRVGEATFRVAEVLTYTVDEKLAGSYQQVGEQVAIQFTPGVLRVRV